MEGRRKAELQKTTNMVAEQRLAEQALELEMIGATIQSQRKTSEHGD